MYVIICMFTIAKKTRKEKIKCMGILLSTNYGNLFDIKITFIYNVYS